MVEAAPGRAKRALLGNPTTKRGFTSPLMMTAGNTHLVYACHDNLVFRGRNGAPDFVYMDHKQPITAMAHMIDNLYGFGDQMGFITFFRFDANGTFAVTECRQMLPGPIKGIAFFHSTREMQRKVVVIGDGGQGGTHALAQRLSGTAAGDISGSALPLLCCAHTAAPDQKTKVKFYSGGETGEIFMHEGAPFQGQGQVLERLSGEYINAMAVCDESNKLFVVTAGKKILVFDTESQEKVCEVANAHGKGIYGVRVAPAGQEASIVTCSSDNTLKTWKLDAESKQLSELATIQQEAGAAEHVSKQLLGCVCFEENGALQTIAVNVSGDLVMGSNDSTTSIIYSQKHKLDAVAVGADQTVYATSEAQIFTVKGDTMKRVSGVTGNDRMTIMVTNEHSTYACSVTGSVQKINGEAVSQSVQIAEFQILDASVSNDTLYVLSNRKEVHELDANSLEVRRKVDLGFDGTCLTFVSGTGEVWVGDKKGAIHILAADSLEQTSQFEGSFQSMTRLTTSPDSATVASGDKQRKVALWSATNKEKIFDHGHHKTKVEGLTFTSDGQGVASVSDDFSLVVCRLGDQKHFRIERTHADKPVPAVAVCADKTVFTVGADCVIREWPASETWDKIPA